MLPDMDGLDVCRQLRATSDTPVLMLNRARRRDRPHSRVGTRCRRLRAETLQPRELLARLRAILRRRVRRAKIRRTIAALRRLEIDIAARAVRLDGVPCELTGYQFNLLVALAAKAGRVLSREALLDLVKGERPLEAFDRSIDVHMVAHPRGDRGRSEEAAARHHGTGDGLRVCQSARLMLAPSYLRFLRRHWSRVSSCSSSRSWHCGISPAVPWSKQAFTLWQGVCRVCSRRPIQPVAEQQEALRRLRRDSMAM